MAIWPYTVLGHPLFCTNPLHGIVFRAAHACIRRAKVARNTREEPKRGYFHEKKWPSVLALLPDTSSISKRTPWKLQYLWHSLGLILWCHITCRSCGNRNDKTYSYTPTLQRLLSSIIIIFAPFTPKYPSFIGFCSLCVDDYVPVLAGHLKPRGANEVWKLPEFVVATVACQAQCLKSQNHLEIAYETRILWYSLLGFNCGFIGFNVV